MAEIQERYCRREHRWLGTMTGRGVGTLLGRARGPSVAHILDGRSLTLGQARLPRPFLAYARSSQSGLINTFMPYIANLHP